MTSLTHGCQPSKTEQVGRAWELPHTKGSGKMYRDKMYICHTKGFYSIQESQAPKLEPNIKPNLVKKVYNSLISPLPRELMSMHL